MGRGFLLLPLFFWRIAVVYCAALLGWAGRSDIPLASEFVGQGGARCCKLRRRLLGFTALRRGHLPPSGMSRVCLLPRSMNAQRGEGRSLRLPFDNGYLHIIRNEWVGAISCPSGFAYYNYTLSFLVGFLLITTISRHISRARRLSAAALSGLL